MKRKLDPKSVNVAKLFGSSHSSESPPPLPPAIEETVESTTTETTTTTETLGTPLFAVTADPQWRVVTTNAEGLSIVRPVVLWEWRAFEDGSEGWVGVTCVVNSLRLLSGNEIPGETFQRYDIQWRT